MQTAQALYEAVRQERAALPGWSPMPAWEATTPEQRDTWALFAAATNKTDAKKAHA